MGISIWTPEREDALRKYCALKTLTFLEIADQLTKDFAVPFGRNACIGKAGRLGIRTGPKEVRVVDAKPRPRIVKTGNASFALGSPSVNDAETKLRCVEMTSLILAAHKRSKRFHASIAEKAANLKKLEDQKRVNQPSAPGAVIVKSFQKALPDGYHCMWFYHLVFGTARLDSEPRIVRIGDIQTEAAVYYGVRVFDLGADGRIAKIVRPRQVAMFLSKKLTRHSLPAIGRQFGGRDHTTVLHAVRKISHLIESDIAIASDVAAIEAAVKMRVAA